MLKIKVRKTKKIPSEWLAYMYNALATIKSRTGKLSTKDKQVLDGIGNMIIKVITDDLKLKKDEKTDV